MRNEHDKTQQERDAGTKHGIVARLDIHGIVFLHDSYPYAYRRDEGEISNSTRHRAVEGEEEVGNDTCI